MPNSIPSTDELRAIGMPDSPHLDALQQADALMHRYFDDWPVVAKQIRQTCFIGWFHNSITAAVLVGIEIGRRQSGGDCVYRALYGIPDPPFAAPGQTTTQP